jgi:hypothetical protein
MEEFLLPFITSITGSLIGSMIGYLIAKHRFRFESLHKKRFEVLEQIYEKLTKTDTALRQFISADAMKSGREFVVLNEFYQNLFDTYDFIKSKKLFLSEEEQCIVKNYFAQVDKVQNILGYKHYAELIARQPSDFGDNTEVIQKLRQMVSEVLPEVTREIEQVFKKSLGL